MGPKEKDRKYGKGSAFPSVRITEPFAETVGFSKFSRTHVWKTTGRPLNSIRVETLHSSRLRLDVMQVLPDPHNSAVSGSARYTFVLRQNSPSTPFQPKYHNRFGAKMNAPNRNEPLASTRGAENFAHRPVVRTKLLNPP